MAFYGLARMLPRFARFASRVGRLGRMGRRIPKVFRRRRMMRKKTQNKIHTFVRWSDKDTLFPSSTGPNQINESGLGQNLAYTFKLENVVNSSDLANLYDQYRINKITMYLERQSNTTNASGASSTPFNKKISVVHDYDDANPLTQEDDYLEYANCKRYNAIGNGAIKITLYPKVLNTVLGAGGAPAYTTVNSNKIWLDVENDDTPHFGIKIYVPGGITADGYGLFKVRAKFHLSMRNSK